MKNALLSEEEKRKEIGMDVSFIHPGARFFYGRNPFSTSTTGQGIDYSAKNFSDYHQTQTTSEDNYGTPETVLYISGSSSDTRQGSLLENLASTVTKTTEAGDSSDLPIQNYALGDTTYTTSQTASYNVEGSNPAVAYASSDSDGSTSYSSAE